jgi:hypothetical protein
MSSSRRVDRLRIQLGDQGVNALTKAVEGLTAAGPGFVAVGRTGVWASTDGVSWDRVQSNLLHSRDWYLSVTAGGPGVVAVGLPNKAWYSSDGLTWEAAEVPPVPADVYPGDGDTPGSP